MAISDGTAGAWVATTTRNPTVTLPSHAAGDMLLVRVGWKSSTPDTDVASCATTGWAKLGQYYNGGGASSNGGGGVLVAVFWKVAESSSETNPVIEFDDATGPTPGGYAPVTYTKGASDAWETPVGASAAVAAATSYSATMSTHVSATAGDMLDAFVFTNDNTTLTVPTVSQAGLTLDTVTEYPGTALSSSTSNDIAADGCNRLATAGTSSAAAVVSGTNSVADPGAAWVTRLRVTTATAKSGTDSGTGADALASTAVALTGTDSGGGSDSATPAAAITAMPSYPEAILADSPIAYWRLGESSGAFADSSGRGHTLTESGTLTRDVANSSLIAGNDDGGISTSDIANYATASDHPDFDLGDGPFSIEFWMRRDADNGGYAGVLHHGTNGWTVNIAGDSMGALADHLGLGKVGVAVLSCTSGVIPVDTTWRHYVVTRSGYGAGNTKWYTNGVEGHTDTASIGTYQIENTALPVTVGKDGSELDGGLDELAIYPYVLTPEQVAAHFAAARSRYAAAVLEDAPIGYWRLGDASGGTADAVVGPDIALTNATLNQKGALVEADTAILFSGETSGGFTDLAMPAGTTDGVTFEAWVKFTELGDQIHSFILWGYQVTARPYGWLFYDHRSTTEELAYQYWTSTDGFVWCVTTWVPTVDRWYHIAVSHNYAAETAAFYIDGQLYDTFDGSAYAIPSAIAANETIGIGAYGSRSGGPIVHFLDGAMDEAAVYDYPVSGGRLAAHHSAATGIGADSGLAADTATASTPGEEKTGSDAGTAVDAVASLAAASAVRTDAGAGADTAAALAAALATATDAGAGADTATPAAATPVRTDAGVGADTGAISVPIAGADVGAGTDTVASLAVSLPVRTEAGTGTESAAPTASPAVADSGAGTDAGVLAAATPVRTDAGTGAEVASVVQAAQVAASDSGVATDTALAPSAALGASEAALGADAGSGAALYAAADAGVSAETSLVDRGGLIIDDDAAVGADTATIAAAISSSDAGVGVETAAAAVPVTAVDAGVGADAFVSIYQAISIYASDSAVGSEAATIATLYELEDTGAGAELAVVTAAFVAVDAAGSSELASLEALLEVVAETAVGSDIARKTEGVTVGMAVDMQIGRGTAGDMALSDPTVPVIVSSRYLP